MRLYEIIRKSSLTESIHTVPLTDEQFDELKDCFKSPVPVEIASIVFNTILESDDLTDEFLAAASVNPDQDARPIVAQWLKTNMPAEMHRFTGTKDSEHLQHGVYSTIHGYNPKK